MLGNCVACLKYGVCDRAHIKTQGSGAKGFKDPNAWILLCREHHNEQGYGWEKFLAKHPRVIFELAEKGWELIEIFGRKKMVRIAQKE